MKMPAPQPAGAVDGESFVAVRRWEFAAGIAIGLLFLIPLLLYGPFEEEEVQFGMFPNQLHYQALVRGQWLFWLNDLGFGTPMPLGDRLDFHPVFAVSAFASLRTALSAVWIAHTIVMVVYFLRLQALTGIRPPLRLILLACYVFSAISVTYFYVNDWVTSAIAWSLYPVLVYYLRQVVRGEAVTNFWLAALRLALLFGFWVLNANPGYVAPLLGILIIYTVAAAPRRRPVYLCLAVAGLICAAIAAERVYFVATEMRMFPPSLELPRPVFSLAAHVRASATPFVPFNPDMRLPFIGLVLGLAALASASGCHGCAIPTCVPARSRSWQLWGSASSCGPSHSGSHPPAPGSSATRWCFSAFLPVAPFYSAD